MAAFAQPAYYNGSSGGSSNSFPLNTTTSNKVQWIYNPGMFNSNGTTGTPAFAGLITDVYIRLGNSANANTNYSNFTIKMAQNVGTQTTWSGTTWNTGMTTVFSASSHQLTGASTWSWVKITLTNPFVYDPTQSLVVEFSVTGGTGCTVAQMTNNGSRRIWGPVSNPTNGTGFGTGLVDFGFDLIPLNVEVTNLIYPSVVCEQDTTAVEITIENTDVEPRSGFLVQYKIDGNVIATEQYAQTIPAGQSANYTFNLPIPNGTPGNFTLSANVLGKNTFVSQGYTVNPAPIGSYVTQGATFDGSFNSGTGVDPDIVAYGDEIQWSIEPPTGFNNSDFGNTWTFNSYEFLTPNGTDAGATHTQNNPSGNANAYTSFNPTIGLSDSVFI
ncbi:MAG: hypothetical protein LPK48_12980, partial [Bacteroidota bacterium]|nr:hypothetical protein [Bacteroidota bacterium]